MTTMADRRSKPLNRAGTDTESCGEATLRRNSLETSGVILDVGGPHGIWPDRGGEAKETRLGRHPARRRGGAGMAAARRSDRRLSLDSAMSHPGGGERHEGGPHGGLPWTRASETLGGRGLPCSG